MNIVLLFGQQSKTICTRIALELCPEGYLSDCSEYYPKTEGKIPEMYRYHENKIIKDTVYRIPYEDLNKINPESPVNVANFVLNGSSSTDTIQVAFAPKKIDLLKQHVQKLKRKQLNNTGIPLNVSYSKHKKYLLYDIKMKLNYLGKLKSCELDPYENELFRCNVKETYGIETIYWVKPVKQTN